MELRILPFFRAHLLGWVNQSIATILPITIRRALEEKHMRKILSLIFATSLIALVLQSPVRAHGIEIGSLKIHHPWTRATPKGADVAGGFMSINNTGTTDDRLVSVKVTGVKHVEIHEMSMDNGIMKMRRLADGLVLPAGKTIVLKPGSFHIMMMGLSAPFVEGDYIKGTLTFEKAGMINIEFAVEAQGANPKQDNMNHAH